MGEMADLAREGEEMERVDQEEKTKLIRTFYIAGVQHHQMRNALNDIVEGNNLLLVPEPKNKYDPNAIRIEYARHDKWVMLGYVPRKFSSEISGLIEIGTKLECVVIEFNKTAKPWEQCKVEIREIKDA